MNPERAAALALGVSLAAVLALGLWLLRAPAPERQKTAAAPTLPSAPAQPSVPTATPGVGPPPAAARGYRLAGTVVGDMTYAIIEDPRGANQLYRIGQSVPGLGQITAIDADRVTMAGNDGTYALQLAPGPTDTPTIALPTLPANRLPVRITPVPRPTLDRSASESSP